MRNIILMSVLMTSFSLLAQETDEPSVPAWSRPQELSEFKSFQREIRSFKFNQKLSDVAIAKGITDLHVAVSTGDTERTSELLAKGVDVDAATTQGITALMAACHNDAPLAILKLLLDANASMTATSKTGNTALHYWVRADVDEVYVEEIFPEFIAAGADVSAKNAMGDTPMHLAAEAGAVWIMRGLAAAGAKVDVENNLKQQPSHLAAMSGESEEVFETLKELGASFEVIDHSHNTPLHYAVQKSLHTTNALLDRGADEHCVRYPNLLKQFPRDLAKDRTIFWALEMKALDASKAGIWIATNVQLAKWAEEYPTIFSIYKWGGCIAAAGATLIMFDCCGR